MIDEVLDLAAAELARQPLELGQFEALRRAYVAMAQGTKLAPAGGLTSDRLLQILRITLSSAQLRQAVVEFRANAVDVVMAERIGTSVHDRRVVLLAAVWTALLVTAVKDLLQDRTNGTRVGVDDLVDAVEATYAEFSGEFVGIAQPV